MNKQVILITGCSSGIGRATVLHLAGRGHTVYATARRVETLADLASAGATALPLDVTDEESMAAAVRAVEQAHGSVGVLVNNAGYGQLGPIEEVPLEHVRRQFETNVIGLVRMTQLALPGMRRAGTGRIVNIGSLAGRLTFPLGGHYCASKHAVESISDALRVEVAQFGIHVSLIEPGHFKSDFIKVAGRLLTSQVDISTSPYAAGREAFRKALADTRRARMVRDPVIVARAVEHAATATRPRRRYVVPGSARGMLLMRALMPDWAWDAMTRRMMAAQGRVRGEAGNLTT
jgi:NAD(P)-dependent dehydrogenase (short-subunit alcohol dehydrogenase family)